MPRVGRHAERIQWERQFKIDVFKRTIQTLNRIGWTCVLPDELVKRYGASFANDFRYCSKQTPGGLIEGELSISGRHIELKMWQNVVPSENRNGGKYDFDRAKRMPYVIRLEMERTRRRIRDYLCNVFEGYVFVPDRPEIGSHTGGVTAQEWCDHARRTCTHYRPELDRARISNEGQDVSADGHHLENGTHVYAKTRRDRIIRGIAYYDLNGSWWIVTGRYGIEREYHNRLFIQCPWNPRERRNEALRRKRLEEEMAKAVKAMNFRRAEALRDILFPPGEKLFRLWNPEKEVFHGPDFCGYTKESSSAGLFTLEEAQRLSGPTAEIRPV